MQHRDPSPYAPLPGTTPAPRGLFVHLWGTLLVPPQRGVVRRFQDAELAAGAVDALFRATQAGWRTYLLGNQDAVARGKVSEGDWRAFESALSAHLVGAGVLLQRSYLCIDDPVNGVSGRRRDSVFRLPNTGAFYHAAHADRVELRRSWVLGDTTDALVAGWRAGLRQVGLRSGQGLADAAYGVTPDLHVGDLREAVLELLELEGALHP
jgi:histidinol phosphatase-like enzyme